MSNQRDLFAFNKSLAAQLREYRRSALETVASRFEHASKVATLLAMLQSKWKLDSREVAKIAVAAAYLTSSGGCTTVTCDHGPAPPRRPEFLKSERVAEG